MRASLTILGKDLRQRSRDGTLILFALVIPFGLAFLLDTALGEGDSELEFSARYAIADEDGGELASLLAEEVLEPLEDDGVVRLDHASTADDARELVDSGDAAAAFIIPEGFTADLQAGRSARLTVLGDVDAAQEVQVAREIAEAFAAEYHRVDLALNTAGVQDSGDGDLARQAAEAPPAVEAAEDTDSAWRQLDSATFYAAGTAVFFLYFATMPGVVSLFEERRNGTLTRLAAAPVSSAGVAGAKFGGALLTGLVCMAILITGSTALFGADWGPPAEVAALAFTAVLAAVGITAAVASFAASTEQASNWITVVATGLGVLGGALFPLSHLGGLAVLSYLTPHQWFLRGLADVAADGGLEAALLPLAVLAGIAAAGFGVALLRLGRMLQP